MKSPPDDAEVKAVKGTLKLRFIESISSGEILSANVSCSCDKCLLDVGSTCQYGNWKQATTQRLTTELLEDPSENS